MVFECTYPSSKKPVAEASKTLANRCPNPYAFRIVHNERVISVGKLAVCFAEDRCLMVKRGPSPFLPPSCFTSISGWFSALFPAVRPKDPALHRHLPCPCDASPCDMALFCALPLASLPDSPMNSLSARTHLTGILQLTNGLVSSRHK